MTQPRLGRDIAMIMIGVAVGASVALSAYWLNANRKWREYQVSSIVSHYPRLGENSETTVMVVRDGDAGHVMEILCLFPPSLNLIATQTLDANTDTEPHWSGLTVVEVGPEGERYAMGKVGYLCREKS